MSLQKHSCPTPKQCQQVEAATTEAGKFGIKIIPLNLLFTLKYTAKQFLNDFCLSCYITVYNPCEKLEKHCAAHTL